MHCSSGTYIRSLARELGDSLTCGGCLARLRRTQALGFDESLAHPLPEEGTTIESAPPPLSPLVALQHLPTRQLTTDEEIDWLIATRHALSCVPDCPTIRKELERQRLVERQPGGGGFRRIVDAT